MTTMRSLAIIALLIGDTSPALAQNETAIRLPPLARRGTPLRTDHPEPALSLEPRDRLTGTRTGTLSYRSRATTRITLTGGSKASIIGLPLASNAGGIGVREPALIG